MAEIGYGLLYKIEFIIDRWLSTQFNTLNETWN